jgi:hypothetical protein
VNVWGSVKCMKFLKSCTTDGLSRRPQLHDVSLLLRPEHSVNMFYLNIPLKIFNIKMLFIYEPEWSVIMWDISAA